MNSYLDLIQTRQSCRSYDAAKPVEREKLVRCIEAARLAPSASNKQPWHYYVVTNPAAAARLRTLVQPEGANAFAADCPAFIVAVEEPVESSERLKRLGNGRRYPLFDLGLGVSQLCLAATEAGLSTCMLGLFDEDGVKELLHIGADRRVQLVVCIGYAADATLRPKTRKPLPDIATFVE